MPTYPQTGYFNIGSLATPGRTGNIFSPYGANGPQYNARLANGAGLGVGGEAETWFQGLQDPYTLFRQAEKANTMRSAETGQFYDPRTGAFINPTATGTGRSRYDAGVEVPYSGGQMINPNDPNQRYRAANITKTPEMTGTVSALQQSLEKTATDSLQSFSDYKKQFTDAIDRARGISTKATDVQPVADSLRAYQSRYGTALDTAGANYSDLLGRTRAAEQGLVQQAYDWLPMYDSAANAAADRQMQALQRNVSRYKMSTGTPSGMGSSEQQILARGAADIAIPLEQAKIQQRYNVLNQIAMPSVIDLANRETQKVGTFDPAVAAAQFQSGTATEQTIQGLYQAASQMAYADAVKYMQSLGVPQQLQQQILSGNIANATALNALYGQTRYQGLQDVLGANVTPATNSQFISPGYTQPSRYPMSPMFSDASNPANLISSAQAPKQVAPQGAQGDWVWDANNQRYQNWRTGEVMAGKNPYPYRTDTVYDPSATQSNSYYDVATGLTRDRYTGKVTGGYNDGGLGYEQAGDSWTDMPYSRYN